MTQNTLGLPYVIDGPIPVPPRYNLLTVASLLDVTDPHWQQGLQIYSFPSLEDADTQNPCASGTTGERTKLSGSAVPLPTFGAFAAYVAETCSAVGIGDDLEFRARAEVALAGLEPTIVEREFARGLAMPGNPYLADPNADILSFSAQTPLDGLVLLETAIAETGKAGVIHATPSTATAWAGARLVERDGAYLRTVGVGTPVVVGYGYLDATPDGWGTHAIADGGEFAYATGPVQGIRSNIIMLPELLSQALDRVNNIVTYRAERYYAVDWDTELQAAVLVDRNA